MSVLVVGSVALDSVETPFGRRDDALGGSAVFFSTAASLLSKVRLVAVVGDDFPQEHLDFLRSRGVDLAGLVQKPGGRTFRWAGRYGENLNDAQTLDTQLNVFADFDPVLPEHFRDTPYVFLANIHPELQKKVLEQVRRPKLVALDTMNFWIKGERAQLISVFSRVDILFLNDGEARLLAEEHNIVKAAKAIRGMGPKQLIIKRGEYGALCFSERGIFWAPAFPLESVFDPTGAGDTFAGGFMGYMARKGDTLEASLRQSTLMGSIMASFTVEEFSIDRLRRVTRPELSSRFAALRALTNVEGLEGLL